MKKLAVLAIGMTFATGAFAQELLTNGGFEDNTVITGGAPNGWTVIQSTGISDYFTETNQVHSGNQALALEAFGSPLMDDTFYQDVATTAGSHYTYSIWAYGNSAPQEVTFVFNGTTLFQGATPNGVWTNYTYDVVATGSSSRFQFGGYNVPSGNYVDDASLRAAVPEPATYAILGVGALALIRRRRSK